MSEVWKPIPGYEGLYEVSDLGRIRSVPRLRAKGGVLIQTPNEKGRLMVSLSKFGDGVKSLQVHRLVALAFLGESDLLVLHDDGNHLNNVPGNLKYGTHTVNREDSRRHGTMPVGSKYHLSVLTEEIVSKVKARLLKGESCAVLARELEVDRTTISCIKRGKTWNHVEALNV